MYCLACEAEIPYPSEVCPECQEDLEAPSHVHGDHISQVQLIVEDYLSGEASKEEALIRFDTFCAIVEAFSERWQLSHSTLVSRLSADAKVLEAGLRGMEESFEDLNCALGLYEEGFEHEDAELLDEANETLEAFFRKACGGLAEAQHQLEKALKESQSSGSLFNLKSD